MRSHEEVFIQIAETVGYAIDESDIRALADHVVAFEAADAVDYALAPVTIEDGEGGVFEVYADGSYCLKVDGELS